jgi:DNA (cytosine-5)-methyltransferase 1
VGPRKPDERRMGLLRGCGTAIVPPLAGEFVTAFMESLR